jgi:hypothetical protein
MSVALFFQFVITLVPLLTDLFKWVSDMAKGDNPAEFTVRLHEVFTQVMAAKTPEAKVDAARKLQDLIRRT